MAQYIMCKNVNVNVKLNVKESTGQEGLRSEKGYYNFSLIPVFIITVFLTVDTAAVLLAVEVKAL